MRAVIQRVSRASVTVNGSVVGSIDRGLLVLLGVTHADTAAEADWMAEKIAALRIFPDDEGKLNRSVVDCAGSVLVVSQFTLYGDARKGTRPSFIEAARPEHAIPLYELVVQRLSEVVPVATGEFGAMMDVELVNDGPVTIILERP
jgi:D-tyrosyl-tRNA(Tyr) deacylase